MHFLIPHFLLLLTTTWPHQTLSLSNPILFNSIILKIGIFNRNGLNNPPWKKPDVWQPFPLEKRKRLNDILGEHALDHQPNNVNGDRNRFEARRRFPPTPFIFQIESISYRNYYLPKRWPKHQPPPPCTDGNGLFPPKIITKQTRQQSRNK